DPRSSARHSLLKLENAESRSSRVSLHQTIRKWGVCKSVDSVVIECITRPRSSGQRAGISNGHSIRIYPRTSITDSHKIVIGNPGCRAWHEILNCCVKWMG